MERCVNSMLPHFGLSPAGMLSATQSRPTSSINLLPRRLASDPKKIESHRTRQRFDCNTIRIRRTKITMYRPYMTSSLSTAALCAAVLIAGATPVKAQIKLPNRFPFLNESGVIETDNTNGKGQIDFGGPFFQSLGTNGRSCFSCHRPDQAWFDLGQSDAVPFRTDSRNGSDLPHGRRFELRSQHRHLECGGRRKAYSLLTSRGLIRVTMPVPPARTMKLLVYSIRTGATIRLRSQLTGDLCLQPICTF